MNPLILNAKQINLFHRKGRFHLSMLVEFVLNIHFVWKSPVDLACLFFLALTLTMEPNIYFLNLDGNFSNAGIPQNIVIGFLQIIIQIESLEKGLKTTSGSYNTDSGESPWSLVCFMYKLCLCYRKNCVSFLLKVSQFI